MKINEVAKLTGITVRTLHYYDEIGLLKPSKITEAGYRLYDSTTLETLQQMKELLTYCDTSDFEPYRNREMKMSDEGYIGYRDEVQLDFMAITDSYIPKIELPMDYLYDESRTWPSEKLYQYVNRFSTGIRN